jgi:hypothetical protein
MSEAAKETTSSAASRNREPFCSVRKPEPSTPKRGDCPAGWAVPPEVILTRPPAPKAAKEAGAKGVVPTAVAYHSEG